MKKTFSIFAIFAIAVITMFTSCSSDDNDPKADLSEILGSWSSTSTESSEKTTTDVVTTWTFNANKTATERVEAYITTIYTSKKKVIDKTMGFTYEYDGKQIVLHSTMSGVENPTSYYNVTVKGNTMRLGNDEGGYFNLTKQ